MSTFYISVRKNNQIFRGLEKVSIDLDTSSNIARQAKDLVSSMNTVYSEDDYARKVYRLDGTRYRFVTMSENWVGE